MRKILIVLLLFSMPLFVLSDYEFILSAQEFGADFDVFVMKKIPDGSNTIVSSKVAESEDFREIWIEREKEVQAIYSLKLSEEIKQECQIWIKDSFANDSFSFSNGIAATEILVFRNEAKILEINLSPDAAGNKITTEFQGAEKETRHYNLSRIAAWKVCSIIPQYDQIVTHNELFQKTRIITGKVWNVNTGRPLKGAVIFLNNRLITETDELGNYIISYDIDKLEQRLYAEYKEINSTEVIFNSFDEYPQSIDLKIDYDPGPPPKENFRQRFYLHFAYDSAVLEESEDNQQIIKEIIAIISRYKISEAINIEGHTDSRGSESYNYRLSYERARAVKNILGSKIQGLKFTLSGYGESKPVAGNDTNEGRAENRRVEIAFEYEVDDQ